MPSISRAIILFAALGATFAAFSGCSVKHIDTYEPKRRDYKSPVDLTGASQTAKNGAIYSNGAARAFLFADPRAMRTGDIVTIRVSETADAKRSARTTLDRSSNTSLGMDALFGLLKLAGDVLPAGGEMLGINTGTDFNGSGETARTERLTATIPAIVREVLPNGNLFIEGHRVILVNHEEHHLYVSGVIRPIDIEGDNGVSSDRIADAEIEFTGRGVIEEKLNPGWLQRGMDILRPF